MAKCCKICVYIVALLAAWMGYKAQKVLYEIPPLPDLPLDQWWGPNNPPKTLDKSIRPFNVEFKTEVIADLKNRLKNSRFHDKPLEGVGFQYGFNNNYLKTVINYWANEYDFAKREKFLNQYPQFKTNIQGIDIHYLHVKPKVANKNVKVYPLLLLHGWPGTVVEFYKSIPLLTTARSDTNFVFELVIPSLPGYGFSQGASKPGLGAAQVSVVMKNLMDRLGYKKYMIQGGDWGAIIVNHMATLFPDNILLLHTNMAAVMSPKATLKLILGSFYPPFLVSKEHESKVYPLGEKFQYLMEESGYMHIQATKPDTVGVGLTDSPTGLAAYILEKFSTWTEKEWKKLDDGGITKKFTLTELLDNIMVYWISNSITTSVRLYSESFAKAQFALNLDRIPITVPSAVCRCPNDLNYATDGELVEKYYNLVQVSDHTDCGHFAIFEEPKKIVDDIFSAVSAYQKTENSKSINNEL